MKEQIETVKNLIRDEDFYKIRFYNYYHQLMQFKEKPFSSKNELNEIEQINEKLQQKINELKTINETILFQCRRYSFYSFSSAESPRHDILNINTSTSTKKLIKYFDLKFFISCREDLK